MQAAGGNADLRAQAEFTAIGDMIADVLDGLVANGDEGNAAVEAAVNVRVRALCARFPIYPNG